MTRWLPILGLCIGLVAVPAADRTPLVAIAGGSAAAGEADVPSEDPFPLRRVFVPSNQLAARVAADADGPYVRLTRPAFEAKVRAAARAKADPLPHLVATTYSATFAENRLAGTGAWTVAFPTDRPGPVPLDPLRIAVGNATWETGTPAVIYRPTTGPPVLWADPANGSTVRFDWSARAVEEPGERRFDLRLPVSAIAAFDLTLPVTHTLAVPRTDALLTGPFPGPTENERRWRLAFGGQPRLELTVRTGAATGRLAPAVRTNVDATYDLAPGQTDVTFAFDLDPVRGTVEEWLFDTDPRLRIVGATIPAGGSWDASVSPDGVAPGRVRVRPADPEAAGRLTIRAVSVTPRAGDHWPLPTVRPNFGLPGDESTVVRLHPDLALDRLDPGDFRITDATVTPDRHYSIALTGSLVAGTDRPNRSGPTLRVRPADAGVATTESLVWTIRQNKPTLAATLTATPVRGPLNRLTIRLPNGYAPLSATATPDDPAAAWTKEKGSANDWVWEPSRPWTTGKMTTLTLTLTGPSIAPSRPIPFPQIEIPSASVRIGTLKIEPAKGLEVTAFPPVATDGTAYRGTPPAGVLFVRPPARPDIPENPKPKAVKSDIPAPTTVTTTPEGNRFSFVTAEAHVEPSGITCTLKGLVFRPRTRSVSVMLQDRFEVLSVRVADRWVDEPDWGKNEITLPIPDGEEPYIPFEILLRCPFPEAWSDSIVWKFPYYLPPIRWTTGPEYRLLPDLSRGRTTPTSAFAVRTSTVVASGIIAAILVLGFSSWFGSQRYGRMGVFLFVLSLGGGVVFLPPGWGLVLGPPFAVAAVASAVILTRLVSAGRMVAAVGLAFAVVPAVAQAPEPVTVFVVREDSGELYVHASQTLLDRLDVLAAGSRPNMVVSAANYAATETDDGAAVTATFTVHVARPTTQSVLIPLTGTRLTGMTLDGRAAFPTAKADGYAVAIPTPGRHELVAKFTVSTTRPGPDREISFGVPDVPQSRLTFACLPTSRQPSVPARRGYQSVAAGPTLTAELGGGKSIALRWRAGPRGPRPGLIVREAVVWDLGQADSTATAAFLVRTEQGGVGQLAIEIPVGLEPGRAAVRTIDTSGNVSSPTGVRDWTLGPETNGMRILNLMFANPIESQAVVAIRFVPISVVSTHPVLRFPRVARAADVESVYGLRFHGVTADAMVRAETEIVPADAMVRAFGKIPELQLDQKPLAQALRPVGQGPIELRPTFRSATEPTILTQSVQWTVGPRADAEGTVKWTATGDGPVVVPFELPEGMTLSDLTGAEVHSRSRFGSRVEVWLKKPTKSGSFVWRSSMPTDSGVNDLPVLSDAGTNRFFVRPAEGWTISVPSARGIAIAPAESGGVTVTAGPGVRSVRVLVRPPEWVEK